MTDAPNENSMTLNTVVGTRPDPNHPGNTLPVYEKRQYPLESDKSAAGGGQPMATNYLKDSIQESIKEKLTRLQVLSDNKEAQESVLEEYIAITLGRESLNLILSQSECEAIRFYFCKNPYGRNSVAAVGVKVQRNSNGQIAVGDNGLQQVQDMGVEDGHASIATSEKVSNSVLNFEVGPPYKVRQFLEPEFTESTDPFIRDLRVYVRSLLK